MSGLPGRFTAGEQVRTISAVVSQTDRRGGCAKVRWSMVLSVQGLRLDQVKMDRVEETGDFPLEIRTEGDVARLTDRQLDPGTLCPGRTVTARYRVAFAEDVTQGRVTLAAEAYDANARLLARQTATRSVVGVGGAPTSKPKPTSDPAGAHRIRERAGRGREHGDGGAGRRLPGRRRAAGGQPPGRAVRRVRRGAGSPSCSAGCCSSSGWGCCCGCGS